jgi:hypothetical protein
MHTPLHPRFAFASLAAATVLALGTTAGTGQVLARSGGAGGGAGSAHATGSFAGERGSGISAPLANRHSPETGRSSSATPQAPVQAHGSSPSARMPANSTARPVLPQSGQGAQPAAQIRRPLPPSATGSELSTDAAAVGLDPPNASVSPMPPSAIGSPGVNIPAVAPLSSPPTQGSSVSTGGTATPDSRPGGGGDTIADCMALWDSGTHMSKSLWRQTCQRTLNGIDLAGETTRETTPETKATPSPSAPAPASVAKRAQHAGTGHARASTH